jgi:hypothetical protein
MTPAQIDYLRDFAITHLPRAQADRQQANQYGGDLYSRLLHTAVMVRGKAGTTAAEFAAANVLESVCLLQPPAPKNQERVVVLHNLTRAANDLCLHTGSTIEWLTQAAPLEPDLEPVTAPPTPLPTIVAGQWLPTREAAKFLGKKPQTLTSWSSTQKGPLRPSKVGGNLLWSGDEILAILKNRR